MSKNKLKKSQLKIVKTPPGETKADLIAKELMWMFVERVFEPGKRIDQEDMIARLQKKIENFSRSPLAQAMTVLEREQFVEIESRLGTRASELNPNALRGLWRSRLDIELSWMVRLAKISELDLSTAHEVNESMNLLAQSHAQIKKSTEEYRASQRNFIELDFDFHDALASAAEADAGLRRQLRTMRMRLLQYSKSFPDARRMSLIVRDHRVILESLQPGPNGESPNLDWVRVVYHNHLDLHVERSDLDEKMSRVSTEEEAADIVPRFIDGATDLEIFPDDAELHEQYLVERFGHELAGLSALCGLPSKRLKVLEEIHDDMQDIARGDRADNTTAEVQRHFIRLDIAFHMAIARLGGKLSDADAIISKCNLLSRTWWTQPTSVRFNEVVSDHSNILEAIRASSPHDNRNAIDALRTHFQNGIEFRVIKNKVHLYETLANMSKWFVRSPAEPDADTNSPKK